MIRTLNAERFNEIANLEAVRPFLGGVGELNLTSIVENPFNYCFMTDEKDGGYILVNKGQGIYEVHSLSSPKGRGKSMFKLMQDARTFMFLQTDITELQTFVPENQPHTILWAKLAGFRENFTRTKCFNYNNEMIGGSYHSLSYEDWILKDKDNFKIGHLFHSQIEEFELLTHEDDSIHDAWVGSVCRSKNLSKAISYYNRWAVRTGYMQLRILTESPFVLDIGNAVLQLNADNFISVLKVKDKCLLEPQLVLLSAD